LTSARSRRRREHPHGLSDPDFDELFTTGKPIICNFHGYPQRS
jgi:xylulose-5-phosphate/fructose-6-phosphate phosphoketolase